MSTAAKCQRARATSSTAHASGLYAATASRASPGRIISARALGHSLRRASLWDAERFLRRVERNLLPGLSGRAMNYIGSTHRPAPLPDGVSERGRVSGGGAYRIVATGALLSVFLSVSQSPPERPATAPRRHDQAPGRVSCPALDQAACKVKVGGTPAAPEAGQRPVTSGDCRA
jgi:hypothetical protein